MEGLIKRHPLQRMSSPSWGFSALIHVIGLGSFVKSFKYLNDNPNPINSSYGWHFQYLTVIGLALCALTFTTGIIADLTRSPTIFRIKNLLSITSAPMAILISTLYWSLRAINPALVVPPELELPLDVDLGFHAVPAVMLIVDILFFSPPWTIRVVPALVLSTVIAFAYWFWIELCFSRNGFYPYPIFGLLDTTQRVALFGFSAVLMAGVSGLLGLVWRLVNGHDIGAVGNERAGNVQGGRK